LRTVALGDDQLAEPIARVLGQGVRMGGGDRNREGEEQSGSSSRKYRHDPPTGLLLWLSKLSENVPICFK
jgi:hypothetical protein